ncbi:MAG TPA: hypothetical protein PLF40_19585 [Kofleriaceae bacterium]|nr:hypothetical protein [Kofleriaceae bacterium]
MNNRGLALALASAAAALMATSLSASAESTGGIQRAAAPAPSTWSMGARVGGYGFRRPQPAATTDWNVCRMNGVGLFVNHALRGALFVETGLDLYASDDFVMAGRATDLPVNRKSGLVTGAVGAHAPITAWLDAYVQLGVGVELTAVSVPYGTSLKISDQKVLPVGFMGVGSDVRVGAHTHLGASFRVHVMGNFDYDPSKLQLMGNWPTPPSADTVFAASPDLAAQGQFYVRRDL